MNRDEEVEDDPGGFAGDSELAMFLSGQPHLMEWSTGPEVRQRQHPYQTDVLSPSAYLPSPGALEPFAHSQPAFPLSDLPSSSHFDFGDVFAVPKTEPLTGNADFEYFPGPSAHGSSSHGSYFVPGGGGSSYAHEQTQQGANVFVGQSSVQQHLGHDGSVVTGLEDADGLIRTYEPHQQQQDLDVDPSYYNEMASPQEQAVFGGHAPATLGSVVPGMGGGSVVPQQQPLQHARGQWMSTDAQAMLLARDLHDQIMPERSGGLAISGLESSQAPGSDGLAMPYGDRAMGNYYDVSLGHRGVPASSWASCSGSSSRIGNISSGGSPSPSPSPSPSARSQQHQQILLKQQHPMARRPSLVGGYPSPDPNFFPRQPAPMSSGFGPSSSSSSGSGGGNGGTSLRSVQQVGGSFRLASPGNPQRNPPHLPQEHFLPAAAASHPATGLQLVHYLLACAEAVAVNNLHEARTILEHLRGHVLLGGTPMQRLAAYFEQALTARLTNESGAAGFKGLSTAEKSIPQAEILEAFSVYYDCIPIGKFGHLTCNQILLDAVETETAIHVLDLHVWHGMQWPAFLQALAVRPGPVPHVRMSAVGSDAADLQITAEKLEECARNLSVPFQFCPILTPLEDFTCNMVETRRGEALVVNSFLQFHGILNKTPSSLTSLLDGLRRLNPKVMAFAENDGNHNSNVFINRFVECLRYYSAVFDAFDASLPHDPPARMKMEQIFAAEKIRNIIACEGPARVDGHETMKFWHKRMEAASFRCVQLSDRAVSQAHFLINLYYASGYTLNSDDCGYLALGWHGMPLTGVSAWHC